MSKKKVRDDDEFEDDEQKFAKIQIKYSNFSFFYYI